MRVQFESPMDRLRLEWDAKAAIDALAASCPDRTDWTAESFQASGEELFATRVAAGMPGWAAAMRAAPGEFRVLDLGCGAGRLLRPARAACAEVHAIDVSPKMLARAREFAEGLTDVRFAVSDGLSLQCVNRQTFHLTLCVDVLGHQPTDTFVRYLLGQVQDKLLPAGVVVADLPPSWTDARIDTMLAMLRLTRIGVEAGPDRVWLQLQKPPAP